MRALRKNPVRTAVTVVGIVLSCALVLAVATSALSLYRYVVQMEMQINGAYNATALDVDAQGVERLADAQGVTGLAVLEHEGYALVNEENASTPYLCIEGLVEGFCDPDDLSYFVSLHLVEGRMPLGPDEIVLPVSFWRAGLVDARVGDTVAFDVGIREDVRTGETLSASDFVATDERGFYGEELVDLETRTFTVCGLYADSTPLSSMPGSFGSPVAGLPAFTVAERGLASDASYQVWASVDDPQSAEAIVRGAVGADAWTAGNDYINKLTSYNLGIGVYQTLTSLTALITAVVVVSSVLLIRNSFAISVSERTRQFGLLSSVGATRRQIRGMVLREALLLGAVAAPLGIAVGYAGTAAVLAVAGNSIVSFATGLLGAAPAESAAPTVVFSLPVVVISVVLTFATVLLSAWGPARRAGRFSAIDAIRSSADVKVPAGVVRSGRLAGRLFGVEGSIAAKCYRRAARPRRATVAALVTGTVLVVTSALLGTYANAFLAGTLPEAERTYDVRYWFGDGSIDSTATPEEAVAELLGAEGVTRGVGTLEFSQTTSVEEGGVGEALSKEFAALGHHTFNVQLVFVPDDEYRAWLEDEGLSADGLLGADAPKAVAVNAVSADVDGRYARLRPFDGKPFTYVGFDEVERGSAADSGIEYGSIVRLDGSSVDLGLHRVEVEVAAFAEHGPWWMGTPTTPCLIMALSAASQVDPTYGSDSDHLYQNRWWEVMVRSDDPAVTESSMRSLLLALGLSDTRLYNMTANTQSSVALMQTARMFIGAFAVIVTLIAITGAFNTMHTGVALRRREFAVLRSVGMTRRGLCKMLACECATYGLHVLLWSAPLTLALSWLMHLSVGASVAGMTVAVPWQVVPASLGAFAVVLLACLHAVRRVDAGASPMEALRRETA